MRYTPVETGARTVLVHARGKMTPDEVDFWTRLRMALRECGSELVLMAHNFPAKGEMDVPLLVVPNGLDAVFDYPATALWESSSLKERNADDELLLSQELARSDKGNREPVVRRQLAIHFCCDLYTAALQAVRPSLCLIWNGYYAQEMILADHCRRAGCPVGFIERAPFPGMIHVDDKAILGGSRLAVMTSWEWPDVVDQQHWQHVMSAVVREYSVAQQTWWDQPEQRGVDAIREVLGIPQNVMVVLFAGQVDKDAQNLEYSPHFSGSLDAFTWFCRQLESVPNLFILGKHHPKSETPLSEFAETVGDRGVWTDKFSLVDCLGVADRVAAVNSTVLYEGLMKGLPVLALGQLLLSGKGIAYEVIEMENGADAVHAWLDGHDADERLARWQDFGAFALSTDFFAMRQSIEKSGLQGVTELGEVCCARMATENCRYEDLSTVCNALSTWVSRWPQVALLPDTDDNLPAAKSMKYHQRLRKRIWSRFSFCFQLPVRIVRRCFLLWKGRVSGGIQMIAASARMVCSGRLAGRRMLVVSHVPFWRIGNGTAYRLQGLLSGLARHGLEIHVVHLGAIGEGEVTPENLADLGIARLTVVPNWQTGCRGARYYIADQPACGKLNAWYHILRGISLEKRLPVERQLRDYQNPPLSRIVARISRSLSIDFFLSEYIYMYSLTKCMPSSCVTIVDTIDVLHMRQASFETGAQRTPVMVSREDESAALAHFDIIVAIQKQEAMVLKSMVPSCCKVVTCYPALLRKESMFPDHQVFETTGRKVLYVASYNDANIKGLHDLFDEIWPKVFKSCPDAKLEVCGSVCNGFKDALPQGVELRGFVPDLAEVYASAAVVVNPVQVGAGLKIKVLEGLEYGCPVVATKHAVDGFPDVTNSGIVIACNFLHFADEVIELLKDPAQRIKSGYLAAKYVQSHFSIDETVEDLVSKMKEKRTN